MEEITAFEEFFREVAYRDLEQAAANYPEVRSISIDYRKLEQFDSELADELLLHPDDYIKAAQAAIENLRVPIANGKYLKAHCRFHKLPESRNIMVQDLGAEHLEKLIKVEGIISLSAEIKPVVKVANFECMHCGEITKTYPDKNVLKTPDFCKCGRRDFKHLEKDDVFINMQSAQMQDLVEKLRGNAPTSHITLWLEDDLVNTVTPGEKFVITGILRKRAVRKDGKVSAVYEKLLEANHLERIEKEFEALEISEEEARELIELSKKPDLFEIMTRSIAPSIYGHDEVKLAIALQLFGGNFNKVMPDGKRIRGEIHELLIGDPGCLIADERVVLGNGAIVKLGNMGKSHLQKIDVPLLTGQGHAADRAKVFHSYKMQPIIEVITESGKCIKGTYNHPLLTIHKMARAWKRLDELKVGDRLACVPWIPCTIQNDLPLYWKKVERKYGPKFKGRLPKELDAALAGLLGYIQGDGWVTRTLAAMDVIPEENDLIPQLEKTIVEKFGVSPKIRTRTRPDRKPIHILEIQSTDIASNLLFLNEKRVPDLILQSRNEVAAEYLAWLFEADGTVFSKGRGRRGVQLRTSRARVEFLRDVQMLLLRFGIHSRILGEETLAIRRANSIRKFADNIGFRSNKKKTRLAQLIKDTANLHHKLGKQLSERVVGIRKAGIADVYDVEIPKSHRFIANGIISHNTSKTTMLMYIKSLAPKCIYVSGKGTSGVGLTASAEKDEFGEGWVLKAGAMVLASGGQVNIDEVDKMDENDRVAMHEALESGQISIAKAGIVTTFKARTAVLAAANPKLGRFNPNEPPAAQFDIGPTLQSLDYAEPFIVRENGKIKLIPIGGLVDKHYCGFGDSFGDPIYVTGLEVPAFNPKNFKIDWQPVQYVFRHKLATKLLKIDLETGRNVKITEAHSVFVLEDGKVLPKKGSELKEGDYVAIPNKLPNSEGMVTELNLISELLKLPEEAISGIFLHDVPLVLFDNFPGLPKHWKARRILPIKFARVLPEGELRGCSLKTKGGVHAAVPSVIPIDSRLMRLLGYYVAEGSMFVTSAKEHVISLAFGSKEKKLHSDVQAICSELFNHKATLISDKVTGLKVNFANKIVFLLFNDILHLTKGAKNKEVPEIVFNSSPELQKEFLRAYHAGDYCTTASKKLASDVLYLFLSNGVLSSVHEWQPKPTFLKDGRRISGGKCYSLVDAANKINGFKSTKPYLRIPNEPFKNALKAFSMRNFSGNLRWNKRPLKRITLNLWRNRLQNRKLLMKNKRLKEFDNGPLTLTDFIRKTDQRPITLNLQEGYRAYLNRLEKQGLLQKIRNSGNTLAYRLTAFGKDAMLQLQNLEYLLHGDLAFARVKRIGETPSTTSFVYDVSTPGCENFVAGYGGVICHNSRFDLIFPIKDVLDESRDRKMAEHIIKGHTYASDLSRAPDAAIVPPIPVDLLRKYIAYARKNFAPTLSSDASEKIKEFYLKLRKLGEKQNNYPVTARQIEGLIRLSEASAKARLSPVVEIQDADRAISLTDFVLQTVFMDRETGRIDSDIINIGQAKSRTDRARTILSIIEEKEKGVDLVSVEDVVKEAEKVGIDEPSARRIIEDLHKQTEIYRPKSGFVKTSRSRRQ